MWNKAKCILLEGESKPLFEIGKFEKVISLFKSKHSNVKPSLDLITSMMGIKVPNTQHLYIINDDVIKENDFYIKDVIQTMVEKPWNIKHHYIEKQISNMWFDNINTLTDCNGNKPKKIIATTDKTLAIKYDRRFKDLRANNPLSLPQIPQSFIEQYITEYNQGNIISDVLVGYDEERTNPDEPDSYTLFRETLKINQDKTINIKTVKDSFSRDEVETLLFNLAEHYGMTSTKSEIDDFNTWIEKNL